MIAYTYFDTTKIAIEQTPLNSLKLNINVNKWIY